MTIKERIVAEAYELFGEKGYEKTSVAEIIEKAGTSKGGFYHHFKSKEEILETITFNYIEAIKAHYKSILADHQMTVVDKFVASFYRLNSMKVASVKDWHKIKNLYTFKGNHLLLRRMGEAFEKETVDYYRRLIEEGVAEKVFSTDYPAELAALWGREVIKFQQTSRHLLLDDGADEASFYRMLKFNECFINQQLGLASGTIALVAMGKTYIEAMRLEMKERAF